MTTPRLAQKILAGFLLLGAFATPAHAWWDGGWTARKKITVDTTAKGAAISESVNNAVVLVRLHDGNFQFPATKDDGSDLRFIAADDKTPLGYHIEKFDALLNEAFVWVKVPELKPDVPLSFWLYYGNQGSKAIKTADPKGTYDSDTVLVYHFAEHGQPAIDSSASANNAQSAGPVAEGSLIGSGLRLAGGTTVTVSASPSLRWSANEALTWSAWIKPTTLQPNATLFTRRNDTNSFVVGLNNGFPYVEIKTGSSNQRSAAGAPVEVNSWKHLAMVAAGSKLSLYLDGETYATLDAALPALDTPLLLGKAGEQEPDGFTGEMDELQISRVARTQSFIKFAALSQGGEKAAKVISLGTDELPSNFFTWLSSGTFGVIIKSLTLDGWVIICVLLVMAILSWVVMFKKVSYLNGISKGNALFMKEWKHVAEDLTVLDDADADQFRTMGGRINKEGQRAMRNASVYRIYHIGVEEIRHRLAADNAREGTRKGLAGRSIQAIRASLDGGLVRETQKINKLIVLLTICISGGPFLGLLGTVVGVMITFAAVAAAGEVNVNAIAPGIAAALLATVAGLAVAIPSLFGYNYILSRVKDAKDDMHIFIDEFVTKMAEFYKETPPGYNDRRETYQEASR